MRALPSRLARAGVVKTLCRGPRDPPLAQAMIRDHRPRGQLPPFMAFKMFLIYDLMNSLIIIQSCEAVTEIREHPHKVNGRKNLKH